MVMPAKTSAPTVLLATTDRWVPTARLAIALAQVGFRVEAVCPAGHPMEKTSAVSRFYRYRGLFPVGSFTYALISAKADLLIPGDDLATSQLHQVYRRELEKNPASAIAMLIANSLGAPENFPLSFARTQFIAHARAEGVRAPLTQAIRNAEELRQWIAENGLPAVLKADGTSGGDGVKVAHTLAEAETAFRKLHRPPMLARALKRALFDHDRTLIRPALKRYRPTINAQTFVRGHEATSAVACWKGEVLASLHFEVLQKTDSAGPATVIRRIDNSDMTHAAETMVRSLKLSGLHGFDFMIAENSADAYLIETNPRSTQIGHLTLGPRHDLPAALFASVTGQPAHFAPNITEQNTIALFPKEWLRDPNSPYLKSSYHDVPWDEPRLIAFCLGNDTNLWPPA